MIPAIEMEMNKSWTSDLRHFWGGSFWFFSNACRVKADARSPDLDTENKNPPVYSTTFTITLTDGFLWPKTQPLPRIIWGNWHGIETSQGLRGIGNQIDSSLWQSQTSTGRNRSCGALWHCRQKSAQRIWQTYLGFGNPRCIRCFLFCFFGGEFVNRCCWKKQPGIYCRRCFPNYCRKHHRKHTINIEPEVKYKTGSLLFLVTGFICSLIGSQEQGRRCSCECPDVSEITLQCVVPKQICEIPL